MKKILGILQVAVLWLWQLPQNLLGLLLGLYLKGEEVECDNDKVRVRASDKMSGGISLGKYVYLNTKMTAANYVKHELGHCFQSLYLGPLYLLVIGLPSITWAGLHTLLVTRFSLEISYYWFYTERWADKLGGVER